MSIAARQRRRAKIAAAAAPALVILALSTSLAAAAPRIPSSEPPGLERKRFVDPPGARLLQPQEPGTILPWEQPPTSACPPGTPRGKKKTRRHRRC
jgi:hypothetical protein